MSSPRQCTAPWYWMQVITDGTVRPCCFSAQDIGSLHHSSIEEIWNGDLIKELRRFMHQNRVHPICQNAPCKFIQKNNAKKDALPRLGDRIFFGKNGAGSIYMIEGWHTQEYWGCWSKEKYAKISFPNFDDLLEGSTVDIALRGLKSESNVSISVMTNASEAVMANFSHFGNFLVSVPISKETANLPSLDITIETSHVSSPAQRGINNDQRPIGVGITSIHVHKGLS
ncbi:hypothetical protein Sp245p_26480 (plasmid) [Azospirillum baldaniorum]|uniref:4Fe4S-binding SPASM domain-containing protein n=1 Tax=Azospirillum baldaniorum TaxID=1064539 RepID=A0A9P1NT98_9PROT|nr:SPASM domain-containing protein [Azospirillum baldaniorum]AWJ93412.1 hypothetical protein Sp245p_26480 [Azospirillum baldaniorum]TWA70293.1 iron-sulfur cluster protein [Azospirillum brasilense]CCD04036.1 protein of unknown function [Azospirillum baldaniorum]